MSDKYFGADSSKKAIATLQRKAEEWFDSALENYYIEKLKRSWNAYYGVSNSSGHKVTFGGEQGELVNLTVNHYKNIAEHIRNNVASVRPAFQARATNTDSKSKVQTELANGLLEYYMREKRLERYLVNSLEHSIVLGTGYIKLGWNATAGEIHDVIKNTSKPEMSESEDNEDSEFHNIELEGFPIYEGDVEFSNLSAFDVVFDSTKESPEDHDWILCRTFKNKFDLIAKYPEFKDDILKLRTKSDQEKSRISVKGFYDTTEDVAVYEFYHKRTESLPQGRYMLYLAEDIVLNDTIMPYRSLPVYRISPGNILGTPYGYTNMFDLLPIQECVNSLYSTIMTNQNATGVQNILNPRGNDVRVNQLAGGMNFIEYNPVPNSPSGGRPESLNLTQTPKELFDFLQILQQQMETISGINSVARGNPESSLKSGTALALIQAQAIQFLSSLQQSYIQLIEDVGTGLIQLLQDFAEVPRIAAIVGISNRSKLVEFKSEDLNLINRVVVEVANPLSQSIAGRVQMAEQLLQMKVIDSPEKYIEIMNTGQLKSITQNQMDEITLIDRENENLLNGEEVVAIVTDRHSLHIREHRAVLADPRLRLENPDLIKRTTAHIQEHINLLQTTDPNVLALIGEQPLGPSSGTPISPENAAPQNPPMAPMGQIPQTQMNPQAAGVGAGMLEPPVPGQNPNISLPQPAQAPEVAPNGMPLKMSQG